MLGKKIRQRRHSSKAASGSGSNNNSSNHHNKPSGAAASSSAASSVSSLSIGHNHSIDNDGDDQDGTTTTTTDLTTLPKSPPTNNIRRMGWKKNHNNNKGGQNNSNNSTSNNSSSSKASEPRKTTTTISKPQKLHQSLRTNSDAMDVSKLDAATMQLPQQPKATTNSENDNATTTTTKMMMTGDQVKKDESRRSKILQRAVLGLAMFVPFCGILYAGHLYICLLVALIETLLFFELVRVRYNEHYDVIQGNTIPLFRTTQWAWFAVAIFYAYGDFVSDTFQDNPELHQFLGYVQYTGSLSFVLYSTTLMLTITTLQPGHIRFQINQLCWTIVVLCLTVGQLKYVMHNIFNGLIWFVLPVCLVIVNDIMAYACGMSLGRKFIRRPFLSFSPNKTWEGFLGAGFFTIVFSWYASQYLAQFHWMTCPVNEFRIEPHAPLDCTPHPVFMPAQWIFPSQIFELLPRHMVRALPNVVQICSRSLVMTKQQPVFADDGMEEETATLFEQDNSGGEVMEELGPCISGDDRQVHSHFELVVQVYPIQIHTFWLALFASVVAPFGGFLASAIKRAYGLKNFAAWIPGHGGLMDRMDCQFLMALCTWVHYNTFIQLGTVSVHKLSYLYSLLSESEQDQFVQMLREHRGDV